MLSEQTPSADKDHDSLTTDLSVIVTNKLLRSKFQKKNFLKHSARHPGIVTTQQTL